MMAQAGSQDVVLRRSLSGVAMVFFGLGTIIGAGIYVLIGAVAGEAGSWTPLSFLVAAVVAAFTGLSYSELVARHPRSAGEAVYVGAAFRQRWLSRLVGWAVVVTGLVSAATLARGFAGYLQELLPVPQWAAITSLVVALALLAVAGVRQSVGVAVAVTVLEIVGLVLVVAASSGSWTSPQRWQSWSDGLANPSWLGVAAGAFLAFYAFIGFEDMVNMAEEVRDVSRALPRAIVIAIAVSTVAYLVVAFVAVVSVAPQQLADSQAPLTTLVAEASWLPPTVITVISLLAIVNGVVVQLLMGPRVMYGLSRDEGDIRFFGRLAGRTQTPVLATTAFAALVLVCALALPLARLAQVTSAVILLVFVLVNLSLIRLRRTEPFAGFQVPRAVPYLGAASCVGLLIAQAGLDLAG